MRDWPYSLFHNASPTVSSAFKDVLQDFDIFSCLHKDVSTFCYSAVEESAPERVAEYGLSQIEAFVTRLTNSKVPMPSLFIHTLDGKRGTYLNYQAGKFSIGFIVVDWRREPETEKAIRDFFKKRNIVPTEDALAGNGEVPDATRFLTFPVRGNTARASSLCRQVLQEVYGVYEQEGLDFRLFEFEPEFDEED